MIFGHEALDDYAASIFDNCTRLSADKITRPPRVKIDKISLGQNTPTNLSRCQLILSSSTALPRFSSFCVVLFQGDCHVNCVAYKSWAPLLENFLFHRCLAGRHWNPPFYVGCFLKFNIYPGILRHFSNEIPRPKRRVHSRHVIHASPCVVEDKWAVLYT